MNPTNVSELIPAKFKKIVEYIIKTGIGHDTLAIPTVSSVLIELMFKMSKDLYAIDKHGLKDALYMDEENDMLGYLINITICILLTTDFFDKKLKVSVVDRNTRFCVYSPRKIVGQTNAGYKVLMRGYPEKIQTVDKRELLHTHPQLVEEYNKKRQRPAKLTGTASMFRTFKSLKSFERSGSFTRSKSTNSP